MSTRARVSVAKIRGSLARTPASLGSFDPNISRSARWRVTTYPGIAVIAMARTNVPARAAQFASVSSSPARRARGSHTRSAIDAGST
jgi:hypothetical protein